MNIYQLEELKNIIDHLAINDEFDNLEVGNCSSCCTNGGGGIIPTGADDM